MWVTEARNSHEPHHNGLPQDAKHREYCHQGHANEVPGQVVGSERGPPRIKRCQKHLPLLVPCSSCDAECPSRRREGPVVHLLHGHKRRYMKRLGKIKTYKSLWMCLILVRRPFVCSGPFCGAASSRLAAGGCRWLTCNPMYRRQRLVSHISCTRVHHVWMHLIPRGVGNFRDDCSNLTGFVAGSIKRCAVHMLVCEVKRHRIEAVSPVAHVSKNFHRASGAPSTLLLDDDSNLQTAWGNCLA